MKVKILATEFVTHDVKSFWVERPDDYVFTPGESTTLAVDEDGWRDERRPFTFTSLPQDDVLQFIIKKYPEHDGVTKRLHQLGPGDTLVMDDPGGSIAYEGEGVFIAGGAGITPFLAIFRDLYRKGELAGNKLLFSNKRHTDVICEKELETYFDRYVVNTLTREDHAGYQHGRIDKEFIEHYVSDFEQQFYVCGPPQMVTDIQELLEALGADADSIIFDG
jgi:hypothetical protein